MYFFGMNQKPKLVLHICCAPDEAYVVQLLKEEYDLYCYFSNPNIQPRGEYEKRLEEAQTVAACFAVPFESEPYQPETWEQAIKGFAHTPEGGDRCARCFFLRLHATASFCSSISWPAFTSVMSVSPHKRIDMLNTEGTRAAREYDLSWEPFNFKKQNGFLKSIELSKKLGLYRQDYCGCRLSKAESESRKTRKKSE